jgi:hypothetical protein
VTNHALFANGLSSISQRLEPGASAILKCAEAKRLVIKNPLSLARVDMLKAMFPEALFVSTCAVAHDPIGQLKGNRSYIVPTEFVNSLPDNLILRAAATWAESIDVMMRERDPNWIMVRYEELVARPRAVITHLYDRTGL